MVNIKLMLVDYKSIYVTDFWISEYPILEIWISKVTTFRRQLGNPRHFSWEAGGWFQSNHQKKTLFGPICPPGRVFLSQHMVDDQPGSFESCRTLTKLLFPPTACIWTDMLDFSFQFKPSRSWKGFPKRMIEPWFAVCAHPQNYLFSSSVFSDSEALFRLMALMHLIKK